MTEKEKGLWKNGVKEFKKSCNYETFLDVRRLKVERERQEGRREAAQPLPIPDGMKDEHPIVGLRAHQWVINDTIWRLGDYY